MGVSARTWRRCTWTAAAALAGALLASPGIAPGAEAVLCQGEPATIVGTPGNDGIEGTPERDVINALGGNDWIAGMKGDDLLCGGSGEDEATYLWAGGPVTVSLQTRTSSGPDGNDSLNGIESLSGSNFGDQLTGDEGNNRIVGVQWTNGNQGRDGDDTINGLGGKDQLNGLKGNNTIDGGPGSDRCRGDGQHFNCER